MITKDCPSRKIYDLLIVWLSDLTSESSNKSVNLLISTKISLRNLKTLQTIKAQKGYSWCQFMFMSWPKIDKWQILIRDDFVGLSNSNGYEKHVFIRFVDSYLSLTLSIQNFGLFQLYVHIIFSWNSGVFFVKT